MDFKNALFLLAVLTGPLFIIAGVLLYNYPPKKINPYYGYRTQNSMRNQSCWIFAQRYAAKLMITFGLIYTCSFVVLSNFITSQIAGLVIGLSSIAIMCWGLHKLVEKKLSQVNA